MCRKEILRLEQEIVIASISKEKNSLQLKFAHIVLSINSLITKILNLDGNVIHISFTLWLYKAPYFSCHKVRYVLQQISYCVQIGHYFVDADAKLPTDADSKMYQMISQ